MQNGVRLHAVLVERRTRPRQPFIVAGPPQGVIRPIDRNICEKEQKHKLIFICRRKMALHIKYRRYVFE